LFASECVDMIQQAADWSISFAAGSNEKKRAFLEDISQGKGKDFLQEVLDEYRSSSGTADTRGRCGYSIGNRDYREYVERTVFRQELSTLGSYDYDGILKGALEVIADQLERDLTRNERENNYITDDTARNLKEALRDLNRCDVGIGSAESTIERLAWFVGGDPAKIRQLQSKLNELGIGERLEEDGVFGKKTLEKWNRFKEALSGAVPALGFIDPLQSEVSGYSHKFKKRTRPTGEVAERYHVSDLPEKYDASVILKRVGNKKELAFMLDQPHKVDGDIAGYHMNVHVDVPERLQRYFYNHKEINESTYLKLKNFKNVAKPVRFAGKILLATGIVLDVVELGVAVLNDVKDSNNFPEKGTVSTAIEIGSRWTGSALGAKGGAMLGAAAGSALLPIPIVGTAVGGAIGGFLGGVGGSYAFSALGEYVVDVTWAEN